MTSNFCYLPQGSDSWIVTYPFTMAENSVKSNSKSIYMAQNCSNPITYHTLSNRLRVVHRYCDSRVECCGLCVMAGSRNEQPEQFGLAHFIGAHHIQRHRPPPFMAHYQPHGIGRRRTKRIHIRGSHNHLLLIPGGEPRACCRTHSRPRKPESIPRSRNRPRTRSCGRRGRLLSRLTSRSDIRRLQRTAVCRLRTRPQTYSANEKTIKTFTSATCRDFLDRYFTPRATWYSFYMGPATPKRVVATAERYMGHFSHPDTHVDRVVPPEVEPFDIYRDLHTHQAHTVIGARIPGMFADQKTAHTPCSPI